MPWYEEDFASSLTSASPNTLAACRGDVAAFVEWAERGGLTGPGAVDRLLLRRYLAYLATRGYRRRTIARRAATLRRYFRWLRRAGELAEDPSRGLSAPKGEARLPHVLRGAELEVLLEGRSPANDEPVDLRAGAVLELLGQTALATTQLYTHVSKERLRAVYEATHARA